MKEEEKKRFLIPRQISKEFHVWRFITFKEAFLLGIGALIGFGIYKYFLPDSVGVEMKVFSVLIPPTILGLFLFVKPIKVRTNVRLFHFFKWKIDFNNRQKIFYYKKKRF